MCAVYIGRDVVLLRGRVSKPPVAVSYAVGRHRSRVAPALLSALQRARHRQRALRLHLARQTLHQVPATVRRRPPFLPTLLRGSRSHTRSSTIAEGPRDASCRLTSCQLPRNSAETTCTTSISCRELTRATESCCRPRLTICATNCSGRASELGGIIDLVDRRRPSLSRCERPPFSN